MSLVVDGKDLNAMSYQAVVADILPKGKDGQPGVIRADAEEMSEADKQAAYESQRYSRQRYRDIWALRRDSGRAVTQHYIQGLSTGFKAMSQLGQIAFLGPRANPLSFLTGVFNVAFNTFSEIRAYTLRTGHVKADSVGMQNVIWDHVNHDLLNILAKRPIKADGTLMEIPEIRNHLIGIMNDDYVLKDRAQKHPDGAPDTVNHNDRKKIARLLDCQYDDATGKLKPNEEVLGRRLSVPQVRLDPLTKPTPADTTTAPVGDIAAGAAPKPRPAPSPAPAMA